jgi:hypothetical protein
MFVLWAAVRGLDETIWAIKNSRRPSSINFEFRNRDLRITQSVLSPTTAIRFVYTEITARLQSPRIYESQLPCVFWDEFHWLSGIFENFPVEKSKTPLLFSELLRTQSWIEFVINAMTLTVLKSRNEMALKSSSANIEVQFKHSDRASRV